MEGSSRSILLLGSGGGGNFLFLDACIRNGWLADWRICGVVVDRPCSVEILAGSRNIPTVRLPGHREFNAEIATAMSQFAPDLVVTGIHRMLGPAITREYKGRLINLHYSLLPAFAGHIGMASVSAAQRYGARFIGVTVHEVDDVLDGGKPLVQAVIPVAGRTDDEAVWHDRVFRSGCIALYQAIRLRDVSHTDLAGGHLIDVGGVDGFFSDWVAESATPTEAFWGTIKQAAAEVQDRQ